MKRVACLTPLPPVKSGIASYSLMLFGEWQKVCELTAVVAQDEVSESGGVAMMQFEAFLEQKDSFDAVFCHIGNNPHHEVFYRYALEHPSVVILHDLVLHHLIVEMTLARGDVDGYVDALRRNHGEAGAAWARGRAAGLHDEIGNFLFPASIELARRSLHVIVHNEYARDVLVRHGVTTPITVTGHPAPAIEIKAEDRAAVRAQFGFSDDDVVIATFGFVTAAKRPEVVMRAFGSALRERAGRRPPLRLLLVGEPAPNVDLAQLASEAGIPSEEWKAAGYVADEDFIRFLSAVDRVVNLRYPSAGETSGALIHVLAAGKEVAVSDYGPFADLPDSVATKIPLGAGEHEALVSFMTKGESEGPGELQKEWIMRRGDAAATVRDYMSAAADVKKREPVTGPCSMPLFAEWEIESLAVEGRRGSARLRNRSGAAMRNPLYGEPAYRVIAKCHQRDASVVDAWLRPMGDVEASGVLHLEFDVPAETARVTLTHGLEGIEMVDAAPFATLDLH